MIISIASGKGGTGKTLVATNLAAVIPGVTYADCDVEEPNGHLFLEPEIKNVTPVSILAPEIHQDRCTGCGLCARSCNFNSLAVVKGKVLLFSELCHACGVCAAVCPEEAITEAPHTLGQVRTGSFGKGKRFVDGSLNIGQLRSAEVIENVVRKVEEDKLVILDAPPGTSCAAVASVRKADACLLVTEPTPFGLHDLKLAHLMLVKLGRPHAVLINRSDIGDNGVEKYCREEKIPVLAHIPFLHQIASLYAEGNLLVNHSVYWKKLFQELASKVKDITNHITPTAPASQGDERWECIYHVGEGTERKNSSLIFSTSLVVLSGKGGTGKTMMTSCLAAAEKVVVAADADVDAANLGILLAGKVKHRQPFSSGSKAEINPSRCIGCGLCEEKCRFHTIDMRGGKARVDETRCGGCGLCNIVCPVDAVELTRPVSGQITVQDTTYGSLVTAELVPGAEASGKLVTQVRKTAEQEVSSDGARSILIDGSPGIGCPVNAALTGTRGVLLVTEPSRSSLHDLERVIGLIDFFSLPRWVVINKHDLSPEITGEIEQFCQSKGIEIIGRIPFDRSIAESIIRAQIPSRDRDCDSSRLLEELSSEIIKAFERKL